jgi:hypothetical protein
MPAIVEADECVARALDLPNQQRDTLMHLIGFVQYLLHFRDATQMNAHNYVICLAPLLAKTTSTDMGTLQAQIGKVQRLMHCLIDHLDKSEVCQFGR